MITILILTFDIEIFDMQMFDMQRENENHYLLRYLNV